MGAARLLYGRLQWGLAAYPWDSVIGPVLNLSPKYKLTTEDVEKIILEQAQKAQASKTDLPPIPQLLQNIFATHIQGSEIATITDDINVLAREAEIAVAEMLVKYPKQFNQFRALQKKGVQWPHSAQMRRLWESTDFEFRPMMIKRDRMVCKKCGVEVSSMNSWDRPQYYHDVAKHPHDYLETLAKKDPRLAWVEYGKDVPSVTAERGTPAGIQQERALLDYMLCHIDAWSFKRRGTDALAGQWYVLYGAIGQLNGWKVLARYIQEQEAKASAAKESAATSTMMMGSATK